MGKKSNKRHQQQFPVFKESVIRFFSVKEHWDAVYPYLQGDRFSRRFLEHFITEYSRAHCCQYPLVDPATNETYLFNVYHSAQSVLLGVHKRHMDPFSRKNHSAHDNGVFTFGYGDKVCEVAVCELLLFRWALKHKVLEYAEKHQDEIKEDMANIARLKRVKNKNIQRKRTATPPQQQHDDEEEEHPVVVDSIEIDIPDGIDLNDSMTSAAAEQYPLRDEYWKSSTATKMQKPRKRRKRYRESAVNTVFNEDIEVKTVFNRDQDK